MPVEITLPPEKVLFLKGNSGMVGISKFGQDKQLFMGTPQLEEVVLFMGPQDLIAVSAFMRGEIAKKGIKSMIYLIRDVGAPLVVLPNEHPSSSRLPLVVSCGDIIRLDCSIEPGTHPEQDILCACEDLSGLEIRATADGVKINRSISELEFSEL